MARDERREAGVSHASRPLDMVECSTKLQREELMPMPNAIVAQITCRAHTRTLTHYDSSRTR